MSSRVIPLQQLEQRINQQQTELETLRQEYEARQADLRRFTLRKEELQTELLRVEAEIQALDQGAEFTPGTAPGNPSAKQVSPQRPVTKTSSAKSAPPATQTVPLSRLLLQIVGEAKGPITVKALTEEVQRRNYVTTSKHLAALVDTRISKLIKKGLIRRAKNQPGRSSGGSWRLPKDTPHRSRPSRLSPPGQPSNPYPQKPTATKAMTSTQKAVPLSAVIEKILGEAKEPIPGRELAAKVLATGYQTNSQDFISVIRVAVSKMDNVDHVPGRGYRLKKRKNA